jgi:glycine reductase
MAEPYRVVHYLNQFFAGIGGEAEADTPFHVKDGALGPGRLLQEKLGEEAFIHRTLVCGDNAFHDDREASLTSLKQAFESVRPDLVVAGPAFNAGRYGLACSEVCALAHSMGIPSLTALFPEAPAVDVFRGRVVIVPTGDSAATMAMALEAMAPIGIRLAQGQVLGPAELEGILPRGYRDNWVVDGLPAVRAVDMLLAKVSGLPFQTEIPLPEAAEAVAPAPALPDLRQATVALVTEGGLVPTGNPDEIESSSATKWARYPISELAAQGGQGFRSIHAGYDGRWVNEDPLRIVPLDAVDQLEAEGIIGELHPHFYVTVGTGTSVSHAARIGGEIASKLIEEGVHAAIVTST